MWLISNNAGPNFRFDHAGLWYELKRINVKAFGGSGEGSFYKTLIKIVDLDLGETFVGGLDKIEGFGHEVGDGCVTVFFSP